jgi:hypothetical protein
LLELGYKVETSKKAVDKIGVQSFSGTKGNPEFIIRSTRGSLILGLSLR